MKERIRDSIPLLYSAVAKSRHCHRLISFRWAHRGCASTLARLLDNSKEVSIQSSELKHSLDQRSIFLSDTWFSFLLCDPQKKNLYITFMDSRPHGAFLHCCIYRHYKFPNHSGPDNNAIIGYSRRATVARCILRSARAAADDS